MALFRWFLAATSSALAVLVLAAPAAEAAKQCAPVTGQSTLGAYPEKMRPLSAQVEVFAGRVTCATARRIGRAAVFGHPRYVEDGGGGHLEVAGWEGQVRMGAWTFRRGSKIIDGRISLVCSDGRKLPIDPPPTC